MGTYRQYCPIARASEILAERWNPLIVRNLMFGADTFSRTVASGWGTAETGGAWTVGPVAQGSVGGGVGMLRMP